jgi:hypothetical protein
MSEARKLRKLHRRARRLGRAVVRSLRNDDELRQLGVRFMRRDEDLMVEYIEGVRVFFVAAGGHIESSTMRTEQVKANRDTVGFHVAEAEEHINSLARWVKLQTIACDRMRDAVRDRIQLLIKSAYGNVPPPGIYDGLGRQLPPQGLTFGVWPAGLQIKAWIEQDNWYFHVMMKMPVGGFVMPPKHTQPLVSA